MSSARKWLLAAGATALATALVPAAVAQPKPAAQPQQKVTGPVATYWMSASTQSGFGMPGPGGAGPDAGAMMRGMMGGGASKALQLQLGSSQASAQPAADHLPPAALRAGDKLPLLTPKQTPAVKDETPDEHVPPEYRKPRGKMLIFWGCGEKARPGQPYVVDFAKMAEGKQNPANLFKGIDYRAMQPPAPGRNKTYGEWPNEQTRDLVPSRGSLVGAHTVRGNYSPEINFTLGADQDFLAPVNVTTNRKAPGGWAELGWGAVPQARAYYASAMGGDGDTVVMWSSSEVQASAFSNPDYLSQGDITRLVANKTLLGPQTTRCAVPKEVLDAAPQAMFQLVAYGGEANFVHPPRPQDPKVAWNQEWAVKVRYRSATGGLLGQAMPGMSDAFTADDEDEAPSRAGAQPQQPPRDPKAERRKAIMRGLGGAVGGALGVPIP